MLNDHDGKTEEINQGTERGNNGRIETGPGRRSRWANFVSRGHYRLVMAGIISLTFLTLTVPHSYEILGHFEKPDTRWLGWFYAFGLEVGAAFAAFIVCERTVRWWARILAGVMLAGAITGSYLLNLSYYLAFAARWEHAVGLAALLPGFIALLGGMLPGLSGKADEGKASPKGQEEADIADQHQKDLPPSVTLLDPLPMLQEALAAMQRNLDNRMAEIDNRLHSHNRAAVEALAKLPEIVQAQMQELHSFDNRMSNIGGHNAHDEQIITQPLAQIDNRLHSLTELVQSVQAQLQSVSPALTNSLDTSSENGLDVQAVARTLSEIGRKVQRREIGIAEFDKRVAELLAPEVRLHT